MGYNISETTGATGSGTSGVDTWTFDVGLTGADVTTVSGDFNEVPIGGGVWSEASRGYEFHVTSGSEFGDLEYNPWTGEFEFFGYPVHAMKPKERAKLHSNTSGSCSRAITCSTT